MPLPRECDCCKSKFIPITVIGRFCQPCLKEIRILNGKMRNETFKKMFKLDNIRRQ
jgi:hypothetical protein